MSRAESEITRPRVRGDGQVLAAVCELRLDLAAVGLAACFLLTTILRFTVGARDVNAPLYYVIAWLWAQLFGLSNAALRFPAMLFGMLAPLPTFWPSALISRRGRMTWCALLACWIPGIEFSQDARCFTLLLVLGTINAICFCTVLERPTTRVATLWCSTCVLLILTHYYSGLLVACQGATYLVLQRWRAFRTWPAALVFVPTACWVVFHLWGVAVFARPDVAWYRLLQASDLLPITAFILGSPLLVLTFPIWLAAAMLMSFKLTDRPHEGEPRSRSVAWVAAGVSLAAAVIAIAIGFIRPTFAGRYLTPFVPGIFLGLSLVADELSRRWKLASVTLAALFLGATLSWARDPGPGSSVNNFETASTFLMTKAPSELLFFLDGPESIEEARSQLSKVGGFFFVRAGHPIIVDPIVVARGDDPNPIIAAHSHQRGTAVLWLFDLGVQGTAAKHFPPRLSQLDPRLQCKNFGRGNIGVVACD